MKLSIKTFWLLSGLLMLMPSVAIADTETVNGITWTYTMSNDLVTLSGCRTSISGALSIPAKLGGYPVASIGDWAFQGCSELASVTIPDSVTNIGSGTFRNCNGLTNVTIPDSVTSIGDYAFDGCTGLANMTIPGSVSCIGSCAFRDCSGLASVTISTGVTSVGSGVFINCSALSSITIPISVNTIGNSAFSGCNELLSVIISGNVSSIEPSTFYNCSKLTSVTIPDSVTSIGDRTFYNCNSLTNIAIPQNVKSIGTYAFFRCWNLTNVLIPHSVTTIGDYAFQWCRGLTRITIGNSVTSIGDSAFSGCTGLTSVTIPDSVTRIGSSAFSGCSGLRSIAILNGTASIGVLAFDECDNVRKATVPGGFGGLPYSVTDLVVSLGSTSIDGNSFSGHRNLQSVTIPDTVTNIGRSAFYDCRGLSNITIPSSVVSIGEYAFYNCNNMRNVMVPGWTCGIPFSNVTNLIISQGTATIKNSAFSNCSRLMSVTMPDSVVNIEAHAFSGCSDLTNIIFLGNAPVVESTAFEGVNNCIGIISRSSDGWGSPISRRWNGLLIIYLLYSVSFNPEGGCCSEYGRMVEHGERIGELPTPTRIGYSFCGWYSSREGGVGLSADDCVLSDVQAYAHWTANKYRIIFDDGGMCVTNEQDFGSEIVAPAVSRLGYSFIGWSPDVDATVPASNVAYTAQWRIDQSVITSDARDYGFTAYTNAEWIGDNLISRDDNGSLRSGVIDKNQSSWLEATVNGAGRISFWWKASSEYWVNDIFDYAYLSVDGVPQGTLSNQRLNGVAIGGATDWTNVLFDVVGEGSHVIRWTYCKDEEDDGECGQDCVWLDEFSFTPKVTVSFDVGECTDGESPDSIYALASESIILPSGEGLHKAKHTFIGWSDGTQTYNAGAEYVVTDSSVEFTAVWAANSLAAPTISSADVANGGTIETSNATIEITADSGTAIYYTLDGTDPTTNSIPYAAPFVADGMEVTIKVLAVKDDYFDSPVAEFAFSRKPYSAAECINAYGKAVSTGKDDTAWGRVLGDIAHDGVAALRSGVIGEGGTSSVEMSVNGAGEIAFWWKASCERVIRGRPKDHVAFYVDGVSQCWMGGLTDWSNVVVSVSGEGSHVLKWVYQKDSNEKTENEDCAWLDEVTWTSMDPIPVIASDGELAAALTGTADANVSANVTNAVQYAAYRDWALSVTNGTTTAQMIKESTRTWLSYALGADALIGKELTSDDVKIESFTPASTDGKFEFTVSVKDVNIGGGSVAVETLKENLKKVLGIEGSATLSPSGFSSDSIDITFDTPVAGKARFTVTPPADAGNSFFMRVKVK